MGARASVDQHSDDASLRNRQINSALQREKQGEARIVKLLLLGAAESGKSTFAKQMKIIHQQGFSEEERKGYRPLIYSNTVQAMADLLEAMGRLNLTFQDAARQEDANGLSSVSPLVNRGQFELTPSLANTVSRLWADPDLQKCYERSSEFLISDSAKYYLDRVQELGSVGYVPNEQDVLRSRLKTTGIVQTDFQFKHYTFQMYDVGGQRSERRKWIHCFDNVTAVIFTAALSAYDMLLAEDSSTNRMQEGLTVFSSICNHHAFLNTSIILFLNKKDIFEVKITTSPLQACFSDYTGPNEYTPAAAFIRGKFEALNRSSKEIYTHFTNATDTKNINFVFDACMAVILRKNLEEAGMV